ncbi:MAG: ABC transporter permease [Halofilum sp. (in: g-proteobacteria)]|nr:ABC transporter permease [Halofilum sp. (in: g-proteobacteria)]
MTPLPGLAARSLWNRRVSVGLTALALAISVALLIGVEQVRKAARASFTQTISGTDLIVGARTSPVQLLLYSVFHIGYASNAVSWDSYEAVAGSGLVAWTVPIALGDSHRGFRVMGTTRDLFEHYRYARTRELRFAAGVPFDGVYEAVLGAEVAAALGYRTGSEIVISHGLDDTGFLEHGDKPFRVVGVLERTGTPLDRSVLIPLQGIEAIHVDWQQGRPPTPGERVAADEALARDLTPDSITAFLVGLKSRAATFRLQRAINDYPDEALTAILPGVALAELWTVLGVVEDVLFVVAGFVVVAGILGMVATLLTSLNERRREMAILRAVGARPAHVFGLFLMEAGLIGIVGAAAGFVVIEAVLWLGADAIGRHAGIHLLAPAPGWREAAIAALVVGASLLAGLLPAWQAYRRSLADGLLVRT